MVVKLIRESKRFGKSYKKLDSAYKIRIRKAVEKIIENPELGKPMRYSRKGTREVYVDPFRLAYEYVEDEDRITFLDLYHKDEQ